MKRRTQHLTADEYRKQFWADAVKNLPHHAAIKMAKAVRSNRLVGYGYRSREQELGKAVLKSYSDKEVAAYGAVEQRAKLWHGTGRYQYKNGKTVDVLSEIVASGGLIPVPDSYAVMLGGEHMESISATPLRIIARSYADIHGEGSLEKNRYGNALWWASYYYGPFYAQVFTKNAATIARQYKKWHLATSDEQGERTWGKKVNTSAKHVWDVFGLGSDIADNYPILMGIKSQVEIAKLPNAIAKAEVRLTQLVSLDDITHFEVPEEKIANTEKLLAQSGLIMPVFPIELGEYVASKQSVRDLLNTKLA